eukprot:scaffold64800_cov48-Phaeocystis_antarctica.AAC.1
MLTTHAIAHDASSAEALSSCCLASAELFVCSIAARATAYAILSSHATGHGAANAEALPTCCPAHDARPLRSSITPLPASLPPQTTVRASPPNHATARGAASAAALSICCYAVAVRSARLTMGRSQPASSERRGPPCG